MSLNGKHWGGHGELRIEHSFSPWTSVDPSKVHVKRTRNAQWCTLGVVYRGGGVQWGWCTLGDGAQWGVVHTSGGAKWGGAHLGAVHTGVVHTGAGNTLRITASSSNMKTAHTGFRKWCTLGPVQVVHTGVGVVHTGLSPFKKS